MALHAPARSFEIDPSSGSRPRATCSTSRIETSIVDFGAGAPATELLARLEPVGVRFQPLGATTLRTVTHLDIRPDRLSRGVDTLGAALAA